MPWKSNLFIYNARESSLVSAESVIYEAFVVIGVVHGVSLHCLHGEREKWRHIRPSSFQASLHIPVPPENQCREAPPDQNKGFINHSFCRNCQKPYWDQARLYSLVNKQVVGRGASYLVIHVIGFTLCQGGTF